VDVIKVIEELAHNIPELIIGLVILYYIFQKATAAKIEVMKTKEIEPFKNELTRGMESYKNELSREIESHKNELGRGLELYKKELELENGKTKIIYDHQKNSFKEIIIAMDTIIQKFLWSHDVEVDCYHPLSAEDYKEIRNKIVGESLFISAKGARTLDIFINVLSNVIDWGYEDTTWSSKFIEKRLEQLKFINYNVQCYFRSEIGLVADSTPLIDIEFLNACRLLNSYHFTEAEVPTRNPLFQINNKPTEQLVKDAKNNIDELLDALKILANYLGQRETQTFYDVFIEVEESIKIISDYKLERLEKQQ
jgi:hypothetical protein